MRVPFFPCFLRKHTLYYTHRGPNRPGSRILAVAGDPDNLGIIAQSGKEWNTRIPKMWQNADFARKFQLAPSLFFTVHVQ